MQVYIIGYLGSQPLLFGVGKQIFVEGHWAPDKATDALLQEARSGGYTNCHITQIGLRMDPARLKPARTQLKGLQLGRRQRPRPKKLTKRQPKLRPRSKIVD